MFTLHPQLVSDTQVVGDFSLCRLLLMNDCRYPWAILVPRLAEAREIYRLSQAEQRQLWRESSALSEALMQCHSGEKLNVAALGNMVPQLHMHHVVRFAHDEAWPGPIWGVGQAQAYTEAAAGERCERWCQALSASAEDFRAR